MINEYPGDYENYIHLIRHCEHHGGEVNLDYDGCKEITDTVDALLAELAEYRTLRPAKCRPACWRGGWDAAIKMTIKTVDDLDPDEITNSESEYKGSFKTCLSLIKQFRAIEPPADCGGACNPLAPDADMIEAWHERM